MVLFSLRAVHRQFQEACNLLYVNHLHLRRISTSKGLQYMPLHFAFEDDKVRICRPLHFRSEFPTLPRVQCQSHTRAAGIGLGIVSLLIIVAVVLILLKRRI